MMRIAQARRQVTALFLVILALIPVGVATATAAQASTSKHNIMLYTSGQGGGVATVCGSQNGALACSGCVTLHQNAWVSANLLLDNNTNFTVYPLCDGGHSSDNFSARVPGSDGLTNYWLNLGSWPD